ncbi:hypothetical protein ACO0QE_000024 [Hanseniaspora vineae]
MSSNIMPAEIQPALLRPLAYRTLSKKYGLNIKSDGLQELAKYIGTTYGIMWKKNSAKTISFLEKFAEMWQEQERGLFIDGEGVKQVVKELNETQHVPKNVSFLNEPANHNGKKRQPNNLDGFFAKARQDRNNEHDKGITNINIDEQDYGSDDLPMESGSPITEKESSHLDKDISPQVSPNGELEPSDDEEAVIHKSIESMQWTDYFKIISAFDQQNFQYDTKKKVYILKPKVDGVICSLASAPQKQITRYELIKERILRNEDFNNDQEMYNPLASIKNMELDLQNGSSTDGSVASHMQITPIKNLIGRNAHNFLLLGLLRINSKGDWCLEDPSGSITIDIQQTIPTSGTFYFPGCTVLAEGIYYTVGNKFYVTSMTTPPSERREETLKVIGDLDLLGVHASSSNSYYSRINDDLKLRLHYLNLELTNHKFVFLGGNLFLDELKTFQALAKMLEALDDNPPIAIVFNGSFSSVPVYPSLSSKHNSLSAEYKNNFDTLASLLSGFKNLTNYTELIFVPGPNDPWGTMASLGSKSNTWPQLPIPSFFTEKMKKVSKRCKFVTNPFKIAYLSLEMMIVRDEVYERMKSQNIVFPYPEQIADRANREAAQRSSTQTPSKHTSDSDIDDENPIEDLTANLQINDLIKKSDQAPVKIAEARKVVKTILDQGHISPFLPSARPINWDLDHTMHMYPLPSFISLCDTSANRFDVTYNGCKVINPGTFFGERRKIHYTEYVPSLRKAYQQELNY